MRGIKFWGKMIVNDLFFKVDNNLPRAHECFEISGQDFDVDQYGLGAVLDESQEITYDEALDVDYDSEWIRELNDKGEE